MPSLFPTLTSLPENKAPSSAAKIESATELLLSALSHWENAVNQEYFALQNEMDGAGNHFPARNAQIFIQDQLKDLTGAEDLTPVQRAAILSAWSTWRPPLPRLTLKPKIHAQ